MSYRAFKSALFGLGWILAMTRAESSDFGSLRDLQVEAFQAELPHSSVHSILQSRDGYLWLGTFEGAVRSDGVRFTVFDRISTQGGLPDSSVKHLFEDSRGALWFGTMLGGVSRYENEVWKNWRAEFGIEDLLISAIVETPDGTVWIGTNSGLFSIQDDRAIRAADPLLDGRIHAMAVSPDGDLLVGFDGRLLSVSPARGTSDLSAGLPARPIIALATGSAGEIWAGTDGGGLARILNGKVTRFGLADGLTNLRIGALLVDPEGAVWIGTEGGGLNRLAEGRIESLTSQDGLPNDLIRAIARDHEGTIWLGTNGGGLVALKRTKLIRYTTRHGLSSESVRTIAQMSDGSIWLGTDGGGISIIRGEEIVSIGRNEGLSGAFIRTLFEASDGTVWIGSADSGLFKFRDNELHRFKGRLPSESIKSIDESEDHTLWVGTSRGVASIRGDQIRIFGRSEGLADEDVQAVAVDDQGGVWVGTRSGLYVIAENSVGELSLETPDSISVFTIRHNPDGSIWLGSSDGLRLLRGDEIFYFSATSGVPNTAIFQILEDDLNYLWLSTNRGIFRFSRVDLESWAEHGGAAVESEHFGRSDGMHTDQCNGGSQPAGWVATDGRIWIPTPFGAVVADPRDLRRNELPPPVTIEQIRIDGDLIPIPSETIALEPGEHDFEVNYAAMSFMDPRSVQFRYVLEGLGPSWVEAGDRRSAFFTNIGTGSYRFQVIASNNDGVWSQDRASFAFRVAPHLWQRPLVQILIAILCLLGIWAVVWLRVRGVEAKRRELVRLVGERTNELAVASAKLYQLSILDPLTSVANRRRFDRVLTDDWKRAVRSRGPISLILIDVDHFKAYNDAFGHQQGDECLRAIARVLERSVRRSSDLVSRYGGEEFAVILPATPLESAIALAETLRLNVENLTVLSDSSGVVTISLGVATQVPTYEDHKELLIRAADQALYQAKEDGRNRIVVSEDGPLALSSQ